MYSYNTVNVTDALSGLIKQAFLNLANQLINHALLFKICAITSYLAPHLLLINWNRLGVLLQWMRHLYDKLFHYPGAHTHKAVHHFDKGISCCNINKIWYNYICFILLWLMERFVFSQRTYIPFFLFWRVFYERIEVKATWYPPVETPACRIVALWQSARSCKWRHSTAAPDSPSYRRLIRWCDGREARTRHLRGCWFWNDGGRPHPRSSHASPELCCCPGASTDHHRGLNQHLCVY